MPEEFVQKHIKHFPSISKQTTILSLPKNYFHILSPAFRPHVRGRDSSVCGCIFKVSDTMRLRCISNHAINTRKPGSGRLLQTYLPVTSGSFESYAPQ